MKTTRREFAVLAGGALLSLARSRHALAAPSGNPIFPGWYADPEARIFDGKYWIFPTYSAPYNEQRFFDAFSSSDLVTWTKHPRILDVEHITWARRAVWAPTIVKKGDWYYIFFGANDIQNDEQLGGIGVARAKHPAGPFEDHLRKPIVDKFRNGAQPIDPFVFADDDGTHYLHATPPRSARHARPPNAAPWTAPRVRHRQSHSANVGGCAGH